MNISVNTCEDQELAARMKAYVYDVVGCCQDVHRELGPWLNEYVYQEALQVALSEKDIEHQREYYFQVTYHGRPLSHKHYMDFLCKGNIAVECKAIFSGLQGFRPEFHQKGQRLTIASAAPLW